jgi:fused signal recognition particle receptor
MDPILSDLDSWIRQYPWALVAITGLGPLLLGLLVERLGRGASKRAEAEAIELAPPDTAGIEPDARGESPAAPIDSVAEPIEERPAEPAAEAPAPTPTVEPVAEAPTPTPTVVPAAEAPTPTPTVEPAVAPRARLRDRLLHTSEALVGRLSSVLGGRRVDEALLEELEEILFTADLGVSTAEALLERVRAEGQGGDGDSVRELLKRAMGDMLAAAERDDQAFDLKGNPHVVLVLGVNGAGKTTTIGKLAARHRALGRSVLLGAGDTFRAAAIEQLQTWGERVGCEVVAGEAGGDPASVAFDTVKAAVARGAEVAIIDTAGRLQTKKPLMEELGKIVRVIGRDVPDAPHEILLVLDANTGQNAISQARLFAEVADVSGLVLTKMDGTAKGGVIVGLANEFRIPVHFVGVGEGVDDLREFDSAEFVEALFGDTAD